MSILTGHHPYHKRQLFDINFPKSDAVIDNKRHINNQEDYIISENTILS